VMVIEPVESAAQTEPVKATKAKPMNKFLSCFMKISLTKIDWNKHE